MAAPVAGLVLAAGAGRRLGRPKASVPFRGATLVEHAAGLLADGGCEGVYAVLGAGAEDVPELPCGRVLNPGWATGMGSSLRAGLAALPESAGAVVVILVDQPGITAAAVARVVAAHRAGAELAVAGYAGRRGHPVLFARRHFAGVAASARGDAGARAYLREHRDLVGVVPCGDVADPSDVDHPADLRLLLAADRP